MRRVLARRTSALLIAATLFAVGAQTLAATTAEASTTSHITGTVLVGTGTTMRASGAAVYGYWWSTSAQKWMYEGQVATANSSGNYSLYTPTGYYYQYTASKVTSVCTAGAMLIETGATNVFYDSTATVSLSIHLTNPIWLSC